MRRATLLLPSLLVLSLLGSDSPREYDDATQVACLEGAWRLTNLENDGQKVKPLLQQTITVRGTDFTISYNDGGVFPGTFRIDPTWNPPQLDHTPASGALANRSLKWLYQIDGDTLKIAGNPDGLFERRPHGLKEKGLIVWTYKRVR
jgi:uncharacterized protein (TIGR03067 family)